MSGYNFASTVPLSDDVFVPFQIRARDLIYNRDIALSGTIRIVTTRFSYDKSSHNGQFDAREGAPG